jgi:uncharacterized protein (DUF1697 family)
MAHVVFLRGVNVGVTKRFQPALVAKELAHLGCVNIGAAGTFIIRERIAERKLRMELALQLPFDADLMICRGPDLLALAASNPFPKTLPPGDVRRFLTIMSGAPRTVPKLPFMVPATDQWQVKIVGVHGRFAVALWRRTGRALVEPNTVLEKAWDVRSTTRNWNTIEKICAVLSS